MLQPADGIFLPEGYSRLTYLHIPSGKRIQLPYWITGSTVLEAKLRSLEYVQYRAIIGISGGNQWEACVRYTNYSNNSSKITICSDNGFAVTYDNVFEQNVLYDIVHTNDHYTLKKGADVVLDVSLTAGQYGNFYVPVLCGKMDVYKFKYNGIQFIPCINPNNEEGLFDMNSNSFIGMTNG